VGCNKIRKGKKDKHCTGLGRTSWTSGEVYRPWKRGGYNEEGRGNPQGERVNWQS